MKDARFLPRAQFQQLLNELRHQGFGCIAPQVRDGAIVFDTLASVADLPRDIRDHQSPGRYRLERHPTDRWFDWANGPQALKPLLFAGHEPLWKVARDETGQLRFMECKPPAEPIALIGVRPCDLAALALQDAHFLAQGDRWYAARRANLFLIGVDCAFPADTCFCASTGDGPTANAGFDLMLGELDDGFVMRAGSERGGDLMERLGIEQASAAQLAQVDDQQHRASSSQQRRLPGRDLQRPLAANFEHPRWEEVAMRCLSCGNCTMVCPTCFCHAHVDEPELTGSVSTHYRVWDSCFTEGHSYLHGFVIRDDTRKRYRQWLTHKLGGWHEQFGRSGCVGCGRCITWCPAGIDITEEATAIAGEGRSQ